MGKINYRKYKIIMNPDAKKSPGFKIGDLVRREYYDGPALVYTLMVVIETGLDNIGDGESAYFIGAMIEGEEPQAGQLLDFVRVTNLFDEERSGALYLTASDSDAPYMDVIDALAKDFSLCYPVMAGGDPATPDRSKYARMGADYLDETYKDEEDGVSRIYRLTRTSFQGSGAYGLRVSIEKPVANPQKLLISFRARASAEYRDVPVQFESTANSSMFDCSEKISVGTEWEYKLIQFNADYPATYQRSLRINLAGIQTASQWIEIAELNIIRVSDISQFGKAAKVRVGKITGVIDPVFGVLEGYGAYFHNLYATRNVNIAGTLTAGDENGSASTFYVGKIHKNVMVNSLSPAFTGVASVVPAETPPPGIGKVWRTTNAVKMDAQSNEWAAERKGKTYCFSIWIKSPYQQVTISFWQNYNRFKEFSVEPADDWRRYHGSFRIADTGSDHLFFQMDFSVPGVLFTSPQLEAGDKPSQYQATDGTLAYVEDYGAWFNKGGIGGTIQNPLLKLNEDGSISSRDGSFVINPDGTGHFASGRFRWTQNTIVLQDVTISWENFDEELQDKITPRSVSLSGPNVFHMPDEFEQGVSEPEIISVVAAEQNFIPDTRSWKYLATDLQWHRIENADHNYLSMYPDDHYWQDRNVLSIKYEATYKETVYEDVFTVFKQFDGHDSYSIDIHSTNGTVFRNGVVSTQLQAAVTKGGKDISGLIPETNYLWYRKSSDAQGDEQWNREGHFGRQIDITADDVFYKAVFNCEVNISTSQTTISKDMIIELRFLKSEVTFTDKYIFKGCYLNRNATNVNIVDKGDIANTVSIDLTSPTETDLSCFEGKSTFFYVTEKEKGAGIELFLSLNAVE